MFLPRTRNKRYIDKIIEKYNGVRTRGWDYDLKLLFDKLYSIYELVEIIEVEKDSDKEYSTYIYNNNLDAYLLCVRTSRDFFYTINCSKEYLCTLPKLHSNTIYDGLPRDIKVYMLMCTNKKDNGTYLQEIDCYITKGEHSIIYYILPKTCDFLIYWLIGIGIFLGVPIVVDGIVVPLTELLSKYI